jgi:general secretion pathway protein D
MTPTAAKAAGLDAARLAMADGRLVEAQAGLTRVIQAGPGGGHSADDLALAADLLDLANRRIKAADPVEMTLQKAELALAEGDLRGADRQLAGLNKVGSVSPAQQARAERAAASVRSSRDAFRPLVAGAVTRANADVAAGRYAEAKSALGAVVRSGVDLSDDQRALVDSLQLRIVGLERSNGRPFADAPANLSVVGAEPGDVRRAGDGSAPAPAPAPAVQPTGEAPAAPAPAAEQPATTAPPAPSAATPAVPPSGQDLINLAMKAEAQRLIAEADQAFNESNYSMAIRKYQVALASGRQYLSADEIASAERKLSDAQVRLRGSGTAGSLLDKVGGDIAVIRQQATAEFDNEMMQAEEALRAGNTNDARQSLATATLTIGRAKQYFSQSEFDAFSKRQSDLTRRIGQAEEAARGKEIKDRATEAERIRQQQIETLRQEKDRKVRESISRARALQQEQKYDEALEVIGSVLYLDPNNPAGLLLRDVLQDIITYRDAQRYSDQRARNMQSIQAQNRQAAVPSTRIVEYPANWPTKTYQRSDQGAFAETPENRRVAAALERPIPGTFKGNTLAEVVAFVRDACQVPADVDWNALREIGVDPNTQVTLDLPDTPAKTVLKRALERVSPERGQKAEFAVIDGIVTVASNASLRQNTVTHPYNVTDLMLLMDIPNFTDIPDMDLASVIAQARGGGTGEKPFGDSSRRLARSEPRMDRDEKMRRLVAIVQNHVDPDGWRDRGGDTGSIQEVNGNLIITTTPANHREITGILTKLRELKSMQINVEARFLVVNQDFFEQIGFDLDVYFNAASSQVRAAQALDPAVQPGDFFDFTRNPGLRRVIDSNVFAGGGSTTPVIIPPGTADRSLQNTVNPRRFSPIGVGQNSLTQSEALTSGFSPFAADILSRAPALGVAGQFLDDIQVDFLIKATQADRRSSTLTAPRLTLTNGQTSNVYVATQRSFIADLTPVTSESAVGFDPEPGALTEGVVLQVEGVVSADRRYVTLNVDTSVSQAERPFRQVAVTAVAGGQLVNSATASSFIELPTINTTRVQTTVTVPDEGTVLMGGQRLVTEIEVETGVPVLSKLPIINRFFTNRIQSKQEQTLLILIKPTILIQNEEEERANPGLNDAIRTGMNP